MEPVRKAVSGTALHVGSWLWAFRSSPVLWTGAGRADASTYGSGLNARASGARSEPKASVVPELATCGRAVAPRVAPASQVAGRGVDDDDLGARPRRRRARDLVPALLEALHDAGGHAGLDA